MVYITFIYILYVYLPNPNIIKCQHRKVSEKEKKGRMKEEKYSSIFKRFSVIKNLYIGRICACIDIYLYIMYEARV